MMTRSIHVAITSMGNEQRPYHKKVRIMRKRGREREHNQDRADPGPHTQTERESEREKRAIHSQANNEHSIIYREADSGDTLSSTTSHTGRGPVKWAKGPRADIDREKE